MIIRLRSRDGLERIEVSDIGTLHDLKQAIHSKLSIPINDILLSKDSTLLTTKDDPRATYRDLNDDSASLISRGVSHGEMVFMLYSFERQVEPAYKKSVFESRVFGSHITMRDVMAKQTRIERQEKAKIESVSIDRHGTLLEARCYTLGFIRSDPLVHLSGRLLPILHSGCFELQHQEGWDYVRGLGGGGDKGQGGLHL